MHRRADWYWIFAPGGGVATGWQADGWPRMRTGGTRTAGFQYPATPPPTSWAAQVASTSLPGAVAEIDLIPATELGPTTPAAPVQLRLRTTAEGLVTFNWRLDGDWQEVPLTFQAVQARWIGADGTWTRYLGTWTEPDKGDGVARRAAGGGNRFPMM